MKCFGKNIDADGFILLGLAQIPKIWTLYKGNKTEGLAQIT
jgi:hypothetical protein